MNYILHVTETLCVHDSQDISDCYDLCVLGVPSVRLQEQSIELVKLEKHFLTTWDDGKVVHHIKHQNCFRS